MHPGIPGSAGPSVPSPAEDSWSFLPPGSLPATVLRQAQRLTRSSHPQVGLIHCIFEWGDRGTKGKTPPNVTALG